MFKEVLDNVRTRNPLVHNITNYVTANDCANMLLAAGASPIMADSLEEAEEITSICLALNINIGTLNARSVSSMLAAGKKANELGHPAILDPVGMGASIFRTDTALKLMESIDFSVIRGNMSEIKTLVQGQGKTRGVDAALEDAVTEANLKEAAAFAKDIAAKTGCIIAATGPIDIVADANEAYCIYNGSSKMASVTGTGCQLSALLAAFVGASPNTPLVAAASAVAAMGLCGEIAEKRMKEEDGNASYRNYIIDAMFHLKGEELEKGARYEVF